MKGNLEMAKATTTIRQVLNYQAECGAWFAENAALFNRVCAFYFDVIAAHEKILDLGIPVVNVPVVIASLLAMKRENQPRATRWVLHWCSALNVA